MTIETKYNIGDNVWLMYANKAVFTRVKSIAIKVEPPMTLVEYDMEDYTKHLTDEEIFPTKEELLKSL